MTIFALRSPVSGSAARLGSLKIVAVVVAVTGLVAALLAVVGVNPLAAGIAMWNASLGTPRAVGEVLVRATPLLLIAATLVPSLRAGIYNIGAPGQLAAGALAATLIALNTADLPTGLVLLFCAVGSCVSGMLIAFVPGLLKARWKVNEIISTLAFNFIVIAGLGYLLNGPMQSDFANLPQSDPLPASSSLPTIIPGTRAHIGLIVAIVAVLLLWALQRSRLGYRLRVFGANPSLARQAGVDPRRYVVWLMTLGGAGAGLAGWMQVAAVDHRLYTSIAEPVGYAGLFVALLGALHPVGIVLAALGLGMLLHGGESLQVGAGVSPEIVHVLLGLILFAYAARSPRGAALLGNAKGVMSRWSSSKQ
ncbi:ABC transporter permease [Geodermatophilus sp. DF01-2]|uniref:ABC transporter permease n=1 Tax=Geodermatophilus sp. DF01-2 TaxID=2559610 RepID=UPI0010739F4E|nr:ABC transporter permease [Geodermatophilus sp. DF01_2]TFV56068.1 ABC transporter permease [Geodermatophilus sp. DF01_2]